MRVCGITVIHTPNYGTVLQAFALQEAVKSLGHEYTCLNYYNAAQEKKFTFFGKTEYMNFKYRIAKKVLFPLRKYQMRKVLGFADRNIIFSEKITDEDGLKKAKTQYDCFITGSDQVWNNQEISHFDDAYFLKFADGKQTVAYAASFGKTFSMLTKKDEDFYRENVPYVKSISVREETGRDIVEKLTGRMAVYVCDPVFLLDASEWSEYASKQKKREKYLLVYLVGDGINFDVNKEIVKKAKVIATKKKLELVVVGIGLSSPLYGALYTPTVNEWLRLILDANMVMTNAFHGVAFSIIFKRQFLCFVNGKENNRMNTRIYGLLNTLGISDRIISIESKEKDIEEINYECVQTKLQDFKKNSIKFLQNSIESTH